MAKTCQKATVKRINPQKELRNVFNAAWRCALSLWRRLPPVHRRPIFSSPDACVGVVFFFPRHNHLRRVLRLLKFARILRSLKVITAFREPRHSQWQWKTDVQTFVQAMLAEEMNRSHGESVSFVVRL